MGLITGIGGANRDIGDLPCSIGGAIRQTDKAFGGVGGVARELFKRAPDISNITITKKGKNTSFSVPTKNVSEDTPIRLELQYVSSNDSTRAVGFVFNDVEVKTTDSILIDFFVKHAYYNSNVFLYCADDRTGDLFNYNVNNKRYRDTFRPPSDGLLGFKLASERYYNATSVSIVSIKINDIPIFS